MTNPIQREALATSFFCVAGIVLQCFHPYYLTKLFGGYLHNDCSLRKINSPDLYIHLCVMTAVAAAHFTVPIRWRNLLVLEGQTLIINGLCVFCLGNYETFRRNLMNYSFLCALVWLIAMGKRNTERAERKLFKQLLSEKTLRTQAEFELSRIQAVQSVTLEGNDLQSAPSTTVTEQAFRDIADPGEGRSHCLETLIEIGKREQWLIDASEVCIGASDRCLGHGGFGLVTSGTFQGMPIALKAPLKIVRSELSLAHIGNELRILRRLRHPHIMLCHGAMIDSFCGEVALVLELVRGQPMDQFIENVKQGEQMPSCDARCQCLLGICRALAYLHSRKPQIVHGDLKASNIMIQHLRGSLVEPEYAHAKLLDFGLARVLTQRAESLGGTIRWKAPELFARAKVKPDRAADVHSFGCLLFFTVSGEQPYAGLTKEIIKTMRRRGSPLRLRWAVGTSLIGQCRMMVEQATAQNPTMRPSMQQITEDLFQWPEIRQAHAHEYGVMPDAVDAIDGAIDEPQCPWTKLRQAREAILQERPRPSFLRPTSSGQTAAALMACAPHVAERAVLDGIAQNVEPDSLPGRVRICVQL